MQPTMAATYKDACTAAAQRSIDTGTSQAVLSPLPDDPDGQDGFDVLSWDVAMHWGALREFICAVYDCGERMVS